MVLPGQLVLKVETNNVWLVMAVQSSTPESCRENKLHLHNVICAKNLSKLEHLYLLNILTLPPLPQKGLNKRTGFNIEK